LTAAAVLLICGLASLGLATARAAPPQGPVSVHFVNAEIDAVTRAIGMLLGRQFIVDPRVKGTMTLSDDRVRPPHEVYIDYLAALRGLGYTVVEVEGLWKVVPEADAKLQAGVVVAAPSSRTGDQVLTQIFRIEHETANNLLPILRPLISPNNTITANAGNNTLVITDYADNLRRLGRIIAAVDLPPGTQIALVPLQHAVAADLLPLLQKLLDTPAAVPPAAGPAVGGASIQIDARTNSLMLRVANPARLTEIRSLIAQLDQPVERNGGAGNIWVVKLKHAEATRVAAVLRATFGGAAGTTTPAAPTPVSAPAPPGGGGPGQGSAGPSLAPSPPPSTGGFVQADTATNSLVITAAEPFYRQVRAVIEQLDGHRPQVFIESMIVEVSGDNAADVGFQWQGLLGKSGDAWGLAAGTNYGSSGNIITLSTAGSSTTNPDGQISVGEGLNLALIRDYGSAYGLAAIARLLQSQTSVNIVSTPNLITLDNEEAKIVVGSNVPFITGQTAGLGGGAGGATTSPFQTIERKDVGITLRLKPQINIDGTVRMTIFQESSSLSEKVAPGTSNAGPSTDKRSIETNVVVDAGQIVVLGGLIEDKYTERKSKIPLLGDIPGVGVLFRSESRTKTRTNLMVFLRPVVMQDQRAVNETSVQRYESTRERQREQQPESNRLLPISPPAVLPDLGVHGGH
jgi:general secretion pathway protein D